MIEMHATIEQQILLVTPQAETLAPLVAVIRTILQQIPSLVQPFEAMTTLENSTFDLVIFDMQGSREGLPLIHNFKQRFPLIPAIAMVPYGDVGMVEQVLERGADDYISQPISLERLKTTLRNALRMRKLLLGAAPESLTSLQSMGNASMLNSIASFIGHTGNLKTLREIEDVVIEHAIKSCDGCITQAALALGIGRSTLYRKMQEHTQKNRSEPTSSPLLTQSNL